MKEGRTIVQFRWISSSLRILAAGLFLFYWHPLPSCQAEVADYTVADETGDWGFPTPHRQYFRGPGYVRMSLLFDTLTWKNEAGEIVPALAETWEYLPGERAYVFKLNRKARWHDGAPVAFTISYLKKHPIPWFNIQIIEKAVPLNSHIIKLVLSQKDAPFLTEIAGTLPIIPRHIWSEVSDPRTFGGPKALIGSGPFKLLDYNKAQGSYLYEANIDYYGGKPLVRRLKFIKIGAEMIPVALKQGGADAGPIPPDLTGSMQQAGLKVIRAPYGWSLNLVMNHRETPLNQKAFRQALAYAIDRKALVEITQRGHALKGNPGFVPPDSPWYNPGVQQYEFGLDRAKALLQHLGYENRNGRFFFKNGASVKLELLSQVRFKEVGLLVKDQLERLGIEVDIRSLEPKTLDSRVLHWQFQLALSGHGGLYEPSFLTHSILREDFNSVRYRKNADLTRLLNEQLQEMDPRKRKQIVLRIQELYAEDLPNLTLLYPNWYCAHNGRIDIFYTKNGIASGIPSSLNKLALIEHKPGRR
jgi:peptide/nickel transport system substrate-binding protein